MIERNLRPAGRLCNVLFGASEFVDGFVRVVSFGFLERCHVWQ